MAREKRGSGIERLRREIYIKRRLWLSLIKSNRILFSNKPIKPWPVGHY